MLKFRTAYGESGVLPNYTDGQNNLNSGSAGFYGTGSLNSNFFKIIIFFYRYFFALEMCHICVFLCLYNLPEHDSIANRERRQSAISGREREVNI